MPTDNDWRYVWVVKMGSDTSGEKYRRHSKSMLDDEADEVIQSLGPQPDAFALLV